MYVQWFYVVRRTSYRVRRTYYTVHYTVCRRVVRRGLIKHTNETSWNMLRAVQLIIPVPRFQKTKRVHPGLDLHTGHPGSKGCSAMKAMQNLIPTRYNCFQFNIIRYVNVLFVNEWMIWGMQHECYRNAFSIHPGAAVPYGELNTSRGIDNDSSGVTIALQPANGHWIEEGEGEIEMSERVVIADTIWWRGEVERGGRHNMYC